MLLEVSGPLGEEKNSFLNGELLLNTLTLKKVIFSPHWLEKMIFTLYIKRFMIQRMYWSTYSNKSLQNVHWCHSLLTISAFWKQIRLFLGSVAKTLSVPCILLTTRVTCIKYTHIYFVDSRNVGAYRACCHKEIIVDQSMCSPEWDHAVVTQLNSVYTFKLTI